MKRNNILLLFFVITFMMSCDKNRVFEDFKEIDKKGWHQDSLVSFTFSVPDESQTYNLSIDIRNTSNYKYCNLYYRYFLYDEKGTKLKTEMPEVFLMDVKTGRPQGSGIGGSFTHKFDFLKNYRFPKAGQYKIKFKQYMRDSNLEEIDHVGFRLEKFNEIKK